MLFAKNVPVKCRFLARATLCIPCSCLTPICLSYLHSFPSTARELTEPSTKVEKPRCLCLSCMSALLAKGNPWLPLPLLHAYHLGKCIGTAAQTMKTGVRITAVALAICLLAYPCINADGRQHTPPTS